MIRTPVDMTQKLVIRMDSEGGGLFGSLRGNRLHRGVDIVVEPGEDIFCPMSGIFRRLGYCYSNDLSYRLIVIESGVFTHRILYADMINPITPGTEFIIGEKIGIAQDVSKHYDGEMTPHIHWEIKIDSQVLLKGLGFKLNMRGSIWVDPLKLLGDC